MSKVNYYLQHPQKEKSLIYLSIYATNGRIQISTGENVETRYWNDKTKRANTKNYPSANGINSVLDAIESDFKTQLNIIKANKKALTKDFAAEIIAATRNQPNPTAPESNPLTFWQYFDAFLKNPRTTNKGLPIKKQSYNAYIQTYQRLKDFQKSKKIKIDFETLDKSTLEKFKDFLFKKQNGNFNDAGKKGLTPNTVALTISRLKTVIREAIDEGYIIPSNFRKVKATSVETTEIAFSEKELMILYHLDLSGTPHYDKVRDLFLIGCYTALRFSDYLKVNYSNVKQWNEDNEVTEYLSIITEKTGQNVSIPILPVVDSILKKHNGTLPKPYPNQVMNRYLKEICKIAGFNKIVKVAEFDKGLPVEKELQMWQMVSTHTARRTGATLIYNLTNDIYLCMSLTGHKSEKQFKQYIRNNELDNAKKLNTKFKQLGFGQIVAPENLSKKHLKVA